MKKFFLLTAFIFIAVTSFSQDIITYVQGVKVEVIVTRITETQIMFRLFSDQRGTEYFAYKKNVESIKYRDGRVETYNPSNRLISEYMPREYDNQQISNTTTSNQTNTNRNQTDRVTAYNQSYDQWTDNASRANTNQQVITSNTVQSMNNWNQTSDIILFRNGTRRMVNVLEITPEVIKYRDFDNPTGAIYSIRKSDVTRIIFQNEREETFTPEKNPLEWVDGKIYLDGYRLSKKEIGNLFQGTNALPLWKKRTLYRGMGTSSLIVGSLLTGLGAGGLAAWDDDTNRKLGLGNTDVLGFTKGLYITCILSGVLTATGGYIVLFQGEKYQKRAVEIYNQSPKRNDYSMNLGLLGNGLGLRVTF